MKTVNKLIERHILIGLITSTDFIQQIKEIWEPNYIQSNTSRLLASWCFEYFSKYNEAPNRTIESIYTQKLKEGLNSEDATGIEMVLNSLSEEYEKEQFNIKRITDQTKDYFEERRLRLHADSINQFLESGNIKEAEREAISFQKVQSISKTDINITKPSVELRQIIVDSFKERQNPLITFPGRLGEFWNQEFVRDAFVALLAPEKRGKTYMMMELAMRAIKNKANVAMFQAGDMTKSQMIRRIGIYLSGKSDTEKYCTEMYVPVVDCIHNQLDDCDEEVRECHFGVFTSKEEPKEYNNLVQAFKDNPDYKPCRNCPKLKGSPWLKFQPAVKVLTWKEMYKEYRKFQNKTSTTFKLSTHSNRSLSISDIKGHLNTWERQESFIPDVIIIDYADILKSDPDDIHLQLRHQENIKWQKLRGLSEEKHCLVITATQTDSMAYDKTGLLSMSNFSEDKRKHGHVTAEYGLNQSPNEKRIGLLKINEIVLREGDFDTNKPVTVLQRLQKGKPFLGSY